MGAQPMTDERRKIRVHDGAVSWTIEYGPNGVWLQRGHTAVTRGEPGAQLLFVPPPVFAALVSQARAEGAAEERERTRRERDALQAELFRVRGELSQRRLP
jgi:hypothetical protein